MKCSNSRPAKFVALSGNRAMLLPALLLALVSSFGIGEVKGQENAVRKLSPGLYECYESELYEKWKLLPQNMDSLIDIIRKIENTPGLNMDLRTLSTSLLHRFRQDGIEHNPQVTARDGILPYALSGEQFYRHAQILRLVPGSAQNFPNDSLTTLERCSLHSMIASSVDIYERGDESRVCKLANYGYGYHQYGYQQRPRYSRSPRKASREDIETLSPQQIERMRNSGLRDPESYYPPMPARLTAPIAHSRCPIENGVIHTPWGSVAGGPLLAGIAAGLEPQNVRIGELMTRVDRELQRGGVLSYSDEARLDNKYLATLAGDLAEVAVIQGPQLKSGERYNIGADGNWNSTSQPRYYFLNNNENLQMTAAEVRGGIDGLVLAQNVPEYYQRIGSLKLSQVLDMYYGRRGLFRREIRAANRRALYQGNATLVTQTHSAAILLSTGLATATFKNEVVLKFAELAVTDLSAYVSSMKDYPDDNIDANEVAVNLTIVLDTSWEYWKAQNLISQVLSKLDNYNSVFTVMNARDGSIMLNSSRQLYNFQSINQSVYDRYDKGLDMAKVMTELRSLQLRKLNEEQRLGWGGGKSDVILFVPYQSPVQQQSKDYIHDVILELRRKVPDTQILFFTFMSRELWVDYVLNRDTDIITTFNSETNENFQNMDKLHARIRQAPRRLLNSRCGSNYEEQGGSSSSVIEYITPDTTNFYRIHPNYFFTDNTDNPPKIKIQGQSSNPLWVCKSRELLVASNTSRTSPSLKCDPVTTGSHEITLSCDGASYIQDCKPYYIAIISSNNTNNQYSCTDGKLCRYPDNVQFRINFENLVCKSGAGTLLLTPLFAVLLLTRFIL